MYNLTLELFQNFDILRKTSNHITKFNAIFNFSTK